MSANKPEVVAWLHSIRQDSDVITSRVRNVWGAPLGSMGEYTVALIRLTDHEADRAADKARIADLEGLLREARELIDHGDFREGYCMCGGDVSRHTASDGHPPVDAGVYYAGQVMERIDWLVSGDDGEDSFRKRLVSDIEQLTPYAQEPEQC